jgi:hypothetical protein
MEADSSQAESPLTILLVHLLDLPYVLALMDYIIISFIPGSRGGQSGPRKPCKWVEKEPVDDTGGNACNSHRKNEKYRIRVQNGVHPDCRLMLSGMYSIIRFKRGREHAKVTLKGIANRER